jgi:hypothetical protein
MKFEASVKTASLRFHDVHLIRHGRFDLTRAERRITDIVNVSVPIACEHDIDAVRIAGSRPEVSRTVPIPSVRSC